MTQNVKIYYIYISALLVTHGRSEEATHIFDPIIFYRSFHLFSLIIFIFLQYKFLSFDIIEIHSFLSSQNVVLPFFQCYNILLETDMAHVL